jgi:hypothetical protein
MTTFKFVHLHRYKRVRIKRCDLMESAGDVRFSSLLTKIRYKRVRYMWSRLYFIDTELFANGAHFCQIDVGFFIFHFCYSRRRKAPQKTKFTPVLEYVCNHF